MYGGPCNICLHGGPLDPWISFIATYHNLYAIIIVVTAFVAMESAQFEMFMKYHE